MRWVEFGKSTLTLCTWSEHRAVRERTSAIEVAIGPEPPDGTGEIESNLIIRTGDATGTGTTAVAPVLSIRSDAGFVSSDFTAENPALGEVASTVGLELNNMPEDALISITTSLEPDEAAGSAFQLAAADAGEGNIDVAYVVNIAKTNLENGTDIRSADITMKVGADWVAAHGGASAVSIYRYDAATETRQVLETTFLGYDEAGRAIFARYPQNDGAAALGIRPGREDRPRHHIRRHHAADDDNVGRGNRNYPARPDTTAGFLRRQQPEGRPRAGR